jgi:phosphatidylglycerol:prolipoprotein diacylglycerol transferase
MGGLILGLVPILLFCLFSRTDPRRVADAFCVPAAAGIMLLKLGCFLNGCCFGHPTTGPFGMVFPGNKAKYDFINSLPLLRATSPVVHPTQLYELFGALFAILIAFLLTRRSAPSGLRAALFAGLFATARLIVLPYRELPYSEFMIKVFYPALYVAVIFVCIVYVVIAVIRQ